MKNTFKYIVGASSLVVTLLCSQIATADIAVVVHPSNNVEMDADTIGKIFLGKAKSFSNGTAATPITQASAVNNEFNYKVLKQSNRQVKAFWSKQAFSGKGNPPAEVGNDAEVVSTVGKDTTAIGFIDANSVDASVRVVLVL